MVEPNAPPPPRRLRDRTTSDLLVLMIAGTICGSILVFGGSLILDSFIHPESSNAAGFAVVLDVMQMLISLLAGFIAGRTDNTKGKEKS